MKRLVRKVIPDSYNPLEPRSPAGLGLQIQEDAFEQGLVLDVITNDEYDGPYKGDGYEVGMVQFRFMSSAGLPAEKTSLAYPLYSNISEYPLPGELIYIFRSANRWWYLTKFNMSGRVTTQDMPELFAETDTIKLSKDISEAYSSVVSPQIVGGGKKTNVVGKYFKDLPDVYRLKHLEGDIIYEGRSGQSIRFGSSWLNQKAPFKSLYGDQAPNIMLRVGANPKAEKTSDNIFGLVVEDINKDASSVWITSDQEVDLRYATNDSSIHGKSVDLPDKPNGNQIIVNTDRVIINTKTGKIIGTSYAGVHWTTLLDITADAQRDNLSYTGRDMGATIGNDRLVRVVHDDSLTVENDMMIHVGKNMHLTADIVDINVQKNITIQAGKLVGIKAPKVIIGNNSYKDVEPIVCGVSLAAFLSALIDALAGLPAPTISPAPGPNAFTHIMVTGAPGAPSALNPAIMTALMKLKADLVNGGGSFASFNSRIGFVKKLP